MKKEPVETGSLAGAEGLEPSTKVLETHVLPLHHAPKHFVYYTRECRNCQAKIYWFIEKRQKPYTITIPSLAVQVSSA